MNEYLSTQQGGAEEGAQHVSQAPEIILPDGILRQRESYDPQEITERLAHSLQNVKQVVVGREDLLKQTLYAMLTREHQLIYSRAGIAKSLYAKTVFDQFEDAKAFSIQLTKKTPEEAIVGGLILDEMKKGNMIHNTTDSLVTADVAFLDEIFDANDPTLRAMLGILNERMYDNGKQKVPANLHTAIATSNYLRTNDVTEAVIDRFLFQAYLLPDVDYFNKLRIDEAYERNQSGNQRIIFPEKVRMDELSYLADIVEGRIPERRIEAPRHILFMKNLIIDEFVAAVNAARQAAQKPELYVSPRTVAKTRDVLNASALLHGRNILTTDDLSAIKYTACTIGSTENQEAFFDRALQSVNQTISSYDMQLIDAIMESNEYFELLLSQIERGEKIPPTRIEQIKEYFNLQSSSELTFGRIKKQLKSLPTQNALVNPLVHGLKESAVRRIEYEEKRIKGKGEDGLLL